MQGQQRLSGRAAAAASAVGADVQPLPGAAVAAAATTLNASGTGRHGMCKMGRAQHAATAAASGSRGASGRERVPRGQLTTRPRCWSACPAPCVVRAVGVRRDDDEVEAEEERGHPR